MGEEAVLRGGEITRARVEHGTAVFGEYGEVVGRRSVATLPSSMRPRKGDTLAVGQAMYIIDAIDADDGHLVEAVLRAPA